MSEPRKNHLNIDGGQVKEDEHVASYKPIPESDTEFRSSKSNLSKSKEKVSNDEAEEKLLQKEDEAKIVTRVDMADAKYVVGDHRNGDAKIELDANKRQFSGLTKEELLKYADDPFWVNLRWFMFVLFWTAWLAMLVGAIVIIIQVPKCAAPTPKKWYEEGPLVDTGNMKLEDLKSELTRLKEEQVQGIFMDVDTYEVLDNPSLLDNFKNFLTSAQEAGIKVIVDLIPNYVSKGHRWFQLSENRTEPYTDYFIWKEGVFEDGNSKEPNNWLTASGESMWTHSEKRKEYYLHHYSADQPDLNFYNAGVRAKFEEVLGLWLKTGVDGVRLSKVRQLLVDQSFTDESVAAGKGVIGLGHRDEGFWENKKTTDRPELNTMLSNWTQFVDKNSANPDSGETVFTMEEEEGRVELYVARKNLTGLRPPSSAPIVVGEDVKGAVARINRLLNGGLWPAIKLETPSKEASHELATFALLLPATPVFSLEQIKEDNDTSTTESLSHMVGYRKDASIAHGRYTVAAVSAHNSTEQNLIACARWKTGSIGFVGVYNPTAEDVRANLTSLTAIPDTLSVHHVSHEVKMATNHTSSYSADNVHVPAYSSIILSYVPKTAVEG